MSWKSLLYLVHRWLGIGMCLLFALWFASGIIMMYVEYPELTYDEHLDHLPVIDADSVRLTPREAASRIGTISAYTSVSLSSVMQRPAYQFGTVDGELLTVFADNGDVFTGMSPEKAVAAAGLSGFNSTGSQARFERLVDRDQWTVTASLNPYRPLHRVALGDAAGTELYLSDVTGQVVRDTNATERFWNWLGSTIHWIYPLQLRQNSGLWTQVIIWLSLIGIVSVITGAWIGIMRLRPRRRYLDNSVSPYKGMMKWHHILGLVSLVFVFTFIFSGLMSMGPWGIFDSRSAIQPQLARYHGQTVFRLASLPPLADQTKPVKEVNWHYVGGRSYSVMTLASGEQIVDFGNGGEDKGQAQTRLLGMISESIPQLLPQSQLLELEMLNAYDDYYYSRHNRYRPLPVYRARFDDPDSSWYHIDLHTGELVTRVTDRTRLERWLFYGLHSLDFMALWQQRPLWDMVVIVLSLLGLVFSITSVVIGWRRLLA